MTLLLVLAAAALLAPAVVRAEAATTTYGVHLGSYHTNPEACRWDSGRKCNNANPGAYVRRGGWIGGAYYNSVHRPTVYAGRVWSIAERGPWALAVGAVAATGYPAGPVVPLVMPALSYRLPSRCRCAVQVLYLPRLGEANPTHVLHLSLEWRGSP